MAHLTMLIHGIGQTTFEYFLTDSWKPIDYVIDNGVGNGYSAYRLGQLVGHGRLAVYDEIDKEMDILTGGPLAFGWVTHFPVGHSRPPPRLLVEYQQRKRAFRRYFETLPQMPGLSLNSFLASSVGQTVYRVAIRNPTTFYGLGNRDDSSAFIYSVGYNGTWHTFPTLTSDLDYYNFLITGDYNILSSFFPDSGSGENDTAPNTNGTGTRNDSS
ncbi:hypothetical protein F5B18DRAFT_656229 [Nemania serpens]|nr:hypothetical protein F5B18DRAFT_656229 [Nemania serpens]